MTSWSFVLNRGRPWQECLQLAEVLFSIIVDFFYSLFSPQWDICSLYMWSSNRLLEVVARSVYLKLLSHYLGLFHSASNDTFCSLIPGRLSPCPLRQNLWILAWLWKEKKRTFSVRKGKLFHFVTLDEWFLSASVGKVSLSIHFCFTYSSTRDPNAG